MLQAVPKDILEQKENIDLGEAGETPHSETVQPKSPEAEKAESENLITRSREIIDAQRERAQKAGLTVEGMTLDTYSLGEGSQPFNRLLEEMDTAQQKIDNADDESTKSTWEQERAHILATLQYTLVAFMIAAAGEMRDLLRDPTADSNKKDATNELASQWSVMEQNFGLVLDSLTEAKQPSENDTTEKSTPMPSPDTSGNSTETVKIETEVLPAAQLDKGFLATLNQRLYTRINWGDLKSRLPETTASADQQAAELTDTMYSLKSAFELLGAKISEDTPPNAESNNSEFNA